MAAAVREARRGISWAALGSDCDLSPIRQGDAGYLPKYPIHQYLTLKILGVVEHEDAVKGSTVVPVALTRRTGRGG
jgi:hypothetical protein